MDQATQVSVVQGERNVAHDFDGFSDVRTVLLQEFFQGTTFDVLRDHVDRLIFGPAHIVDGDNLWVFQSSHEAGFIEVLFGIRSGSEAFRLGNFDRHLSPQFRVIAQVNATEVPSPRMRSSR
jgi:hypothetical protein